MITFSHFCSLLSCFFTPTVTGAVMKTGSQRPGRSLYLLRWWRRCRKSRAQPEKRNSSPLCQVRGHYTWMHCDQTLSACACGLVRRRWWAAGVCQLWQCLPTCSVPLGVSVTSQCATLSCGDNFVCVCVFNSATHCALISSEPKPVYAQPGQPDVDLPVSPADAPVPSVTHDDSILRCVSPACTILEMSRMKRPNCMFVVRPQAEHEAGEV